MTVEPIRPSADALTSASNSPGSHPDGIGLLLAFTAAVLVVTLAVVFLAATGRWWALGVTMAVDVIVTFGVSWMTARLLADDGD